MDENHICAILGKRVGGNASVYTRCGLFVPKPLSPGASAQPMPGRSRFASLRWLITAFPPVAGVLAGTSVGKTTKAASLAVRRLWFAVMPDSELFVDGAFAVGAAVGMPVRVAQKSDGVQLGFRHGNAPGIFAPDDVHQFLDRKSTRLNSSH